MLRNNWSQRSRSNWLTNGDRNTLHFHHHAIYRHHFNKIEKIRDGNGGLVQSQNEVSEVAVLFFQNLFSMEHGGIDFDYWFVGMELPKVTDVEYARPDKAFKADEVWKVVKSMHPIKAHGPDGVHAKFCQTHWQTLGSSISSMLLTCLNNWVSWFSLNEIYVSLIPKVKKSTFMVEFRPISLYNVVYKILSKVLVNRIKPALQSLIGEV